MVRLLDLTLIGAPPCYPTEHVEQHIKKTVRGKSTFEFGLDLILDSLEKIRGQSARPKRRGR